MSESLKDPTAQEVERLRDRLRELERPWRRIDRALFDTLLASVNDGVWAATADGSRMLYLNPAIERIYGRPLDEFYARPGLWRDVVHPEDVERVDHASNELLQGTAVEVEYRIRRPDGEVRWVLDRKNFVVDAEGEPLGIGGIVTDITDRKRADDALRESESRLRLALDALDGGVWDWNVRTGDVHFTPSWPRMLGYRPDEIEGHVRTWAQSLHPDDRPAVMKVLNEHFEGNAPYYTEHRLRTKSGRWIWVLGRGQVVERDERGNPLRMTGTNVSIDQRKRAEEERRTLEAAVQQAQKLESLGLLAGGIAHDFNNLLTGILGNAEMAALDLEPSAPSRAHLAQIEQSALRAADLCQQLLAYSGKGRFVVKPLDLSQLVRDMAQLLEVSISKRVRLECDFEAGLPAVEGDVNQVRQVVMNLITNASEAIGDTDGTITIRTALTDEDRNPRAVRYGELSAEGSYVCLEVADTGSGMDERTRARIFDPFFTTKFTGRGLGLAAVLGIVRSHRGAIELTSRPGSGTTFRILFPPSSRPPEAQARSREAAEPWRGDGTVLVVDDEESVRAMARTILEGHGFSVLTADDGKRGLEIYRRHAEEISVVLLDLTMPAMGGQECLRALREVDGGVRVLLTSGYSEQDAVARIGEQGVAGFLAKPYRREELLAKLRDVLRT